VGGAAICESDDSEVSKDSNLATVSERDGMFGAGWGGGGAACGSGWGGGGAACGSG
jgi:hypothetical protein